MRQKISALIFVVATCLASLWLGRDVVRSTGFYLALLAGLIPALACLWIVIRTRTDREFLMRLFIAALFVRVIIAYIIYDRHLQEFLGGDAQTYDAFGYSLLQSWRGLVDPNSPWLARYTATSASGFGMYYFVAGIYYVIDQNPLAIQLINCAFGAGAVIAGYKITMMVYPEQRVARLVALMSAFSPSLVLWTSQGLKDGPILLCLCLCTLFTLKVRDKFELKSFVLLIVSLLCLYTMRSYAASIIFVAIAGTFIFAAKKFTPSRILFGGVLVTLIGLTIVYFGMGDLAKTGIDLEQIQRVRVWGAKAANTGFGGDVDITDPAAAIGFLPIGVLYVLFAPFPWMINNLRQLITLPELIIWWALVPMMMRGYWHAIRHRLRESFVICVFILSLTLAYALYQSNAGTAYRHRAQLYVFFFIFIAIGLDLRRTARLKRQAQAYKPTRQAAFTMAAGTRRVEGKSV
jgi:hypothetical protein